jgi:hypothetical protein
MNCCGAAELVGINDSLWTPKDQLLYYVDTYQILLGRKGKAFMPFSYAWDTNGKSGFRSRRQGNSRLKAWKRLIEDNDLGEVHIMRTSKHNPNYGTATRIKAGIWVPNDRAIAKFVIAKGWRNGINHWKVA